MNLQSWVGSVNLAVLTYVSIEEPTIQLFLLFSKLDHFTLTWYEWSFVIRYMYQIHLKFYIFVSLMYSLFLDAKFGLRDLWTAIILPEAELIYLTKFKTCKNMDDLFFFQSHVVFILKLVTQSPYLLVFKTKCLEKRELNYLFTKKKEEGFIFHIPTYNWSKVKTWIILISFGI